MAFTDMEAILTKIAAGVLLPFAQIGLLGQGRLFWIYMVTGLALAFAAYALRGQDSAFRARLFDRESWTGQSARNDYAMYFINPVIQAVILSGVFFYIGEISGFVAGLVEAAGVTGKVTGSSALMLGAGLTLALFLTDDFMRWFCHYLAHKVPALWEFHKVHHSAEVLNFATANRIHPVELAFSGICMTAVAAVVNGVFIGAFGAELTVLTVSGANILWVGFNIAGGVLRHSPFWVSFGEPVERWLISPAMHHIHHSDNPRHFDRNFGSSLAVWDRLAGTIHIPDGNEITGFGLGAETARFRSIKAIYFHPFKAACALFKKPGRHRRPSR